MTLTIEIQGAENLRRSRIPSDGGDTSVYGQHLDMLGDGTRLDRVPFHLSQISDQTAMGSFFNLSAPLPIVNHAGQVSRPDQSYLASIPLPDALEAGGLELEWNHSTEEILAAEFDLEACERVSRVDCFS